MKTTLVELAYKLMENNRVHVTERSVLGSFTLNTYGTGNIE